MFAFNTLLVHSKQFGVAAFGTAVFFDESTDKASAFLAQLSIEEMGLRFKMWVVSGSEGECSDDYREEKDQFVHDLVLNLNNNKWLQIHTKGNV